MPNVEIQIVSTPPGEAPESIRKAWVGMVLPVHPSFPSPITIRGFGVISGPRKAWWAWLLYLLGRGERETGYMVEAKIALAHLTEHNPDAAYWWKTNTPHLFRPGQCLLFHQEVCVPITSSENPPTS